MVQFKCFSCTYDVVYPSSLCICYQTAHAEFSQANVGNQSGVTREEKLKELAAAYDSFTELKGNLEEGTKV